MTSKLRNAAVAAILAVCAPLSMNLSAAGDGGLFRLAEACAGATTCTSSFFSICSSSNGNDYNDYKCSTGCGSRDGELGPFYQW